MKHFSIRIVALTALFATFTIYADPMMASTRTYCFGRYLIDIPADAPVVASGNEYISTQIKFEKLDASGFSGRVEAKENKYKNADSEYNAKFVKLAYSKDNNKRIVISLLNAFGSKIYGIDAYKLARPGYIFEANASISSDYFAASLDAYETLVNTVRYRPTSNIPSEPGFCFENGFIPSEGKAPEDEQANLVFQFKNNPDVVIRVESVVYFGSQPSLLERLGQSNILLRILSSVKTINKGAREMNGMHGEEYLTKYPSDDKTGTASRMVWETMGRIADPLKPSIHLEVSTGEGSGGGVTVPSSLTDKQTMALYEQVLNSIRIRPIH